MRDFVTICTVVLAFVYVRYRLVAHHLELCLLSSTQERTARHVRALRLANCVLSALGANVALGLLIVATFPVRRTTQHDSTRSSLH